MKEKKISKQTLVVYRTKKKKLSITTRTKKTAYLKKTRVNNNNNNNSATCCKKKTKANLKKKPFTPQTSKRKNRLLQLTTEIRTEKKKNCKQTLESNGVHTLKEPTGIVLYLEFSWTKIIRKKGGMATPQNASQVRFLFTYKQTRPSVCPASAHVHKQANMHMQKTLKKVNK